MSFEECIEASKEPLYREFELFLADDYLSLDDFPLYNIEADY